MGPLSAFTLGIEPWLLPGEWLTDMAEPNTVSLSESFDGDWISGRALSVRKTGQTGGQPEGSGSREAY